MGSISELRDLIGKRVGELNFYGSGPGVWACGVFSDDYGVRPDSFRYAVGGIGQPAAPPDWLPAPPPATIEIGHIGNRTLDEMLKGGEIDAIFSSVAPSGLRKKPPTARRLFENVEQVERDWFAKTKIFPIQHVVVIRREVYEKNRWLARTLYHAFKQVKDIALRRYRPPAASASIPWLASYTQSVIALMDEDWWPYGIAPNRRILDTLARYHHEQGLSHRQIGIEEMFAPETLTD